MMINKFLTLSVLLSLCLCSTTANAQTITGGGGFGVAKLTGDLGEGGSFGLNYFLEANYFLTEQLSVGGEANFSAIAFGNDEGLFGISTYGASEYLLTGNYFFTEGTVRPFAGLGLGLAKIATPEVTTTDSNGNAQTIEEESKINFGLSPRLGVMLGNFGIDFKYNFAGKTPETEVFNTATSGETFNYYSVTIKFVYPFEL